MNIRNNNGRYELKIYRKNAITNVQVKPNSAHDPKVLKGIFTGFLNRAHKICDERFRDEEINFLIDNFTENGYDRGTLVQIATELSTNKSMLNDHQTNQNQSQNQEQDQEHNKVVKLP